MSGTQIYGSRRARGKTFPNAHTNSFIVAQRITAVEAESQQTKDFIGLADIEKYLGLSGNGNGSSAELTTACRRAVNAVGGHFPVG